MRRHAGRKQVETTVYETVCDQCGEVIDTSTPDADEQRIHLSWGVLDCWWGEDMPDGPVDLCGVPCAHAFLDRVATLIGGSVQ